jgi:predicted phosphodiesterase
VHPHEAEQVGNTIKAARWFAGQQRVTVIGHTHKPPVYRSVKKSRL